MKILCVSDYHADERLAKNIEDLAEAEKVDAVINAGDFVSRSFAEKVLNRTKFQTFVVRGNWDGEITIKNKNVHLLKDDVMEYKGYYFIGVEFGYYSHIIRLAKNLDNRKIILITHEPPYDILDLTYFGASAGLIDLRAIVNEIKPLIHVFGHIHESAGYIKHKGTLFVNAALPEFRKAFVVHLPSLEVKSFDV
ncbi:MAG: metallophosphoesterase family protein [Candidatus Aenigmarchaeota archaeon]|nr:metallophosphoesterase family protein [Candidatus Aenigmarchaeota archaeon]